MSEDVFVPDTETTYRTATEFKPLPDYAERPEEKTFSSEKEGLESAAEELLKSRAVPKVEDTPDNIIERNYRWQQGQGDPIPEHYTLEAKRAAEDLTRARASELEANSPAQELTNAIDQVRAVWDQQQTPQQQQPQQQPQQPVQPQEVQATADAQQPQQPQNEQDQIRQVLEQHPAVRNALAAELAATEQHRAAYAQGLRQSATVAAASLLANFPELAQVPTEHLQSVITSMAASNPQRAAAIDAQLGRTQSLFNQYKQAEAAQQQIQAQQMQSWVSAQNAEFERTVASKETPEVMNKIAQNVVELVAEYGVSQKDLAEVWKSQPILHSAAFQRCLVDAGKYRMAQRESQSKLDRSAPPVQRPGVSRPNNDDDSGVTSALARFRSNPGPRTGADLLNARRLATRNK